MWCICNLANGTQQAVKWDPKANGQDCLEKVCMSLGIICEMEYFGLEHWTQNQKETHTPQWINLRNPLSYDSGCSGSGNGIPLMLALRVKFWVPVHFILQDSVRNLFYMQAKRDLLEGRLTPNDWNTSAKLAALLCQADGLRFNESSLRAECPLRMRSELLAQQQLQQQQAQLAQQSRLDQQQRKEKEHVLSFKKRRLSKQKSVEHIECCANAGTMTSQQTSSTSPSASLSASVVCSSSQSTSSSSSSPSNSSSQTNLEERLATNPLRMYEKYVIVPSSENQTGEESVKIPNNYLQKIAIEHDKLHRLQMSAQTAKYWLLNGIQELEGYGEEVFSGVATNEHATRCDIAVGAHGITVTRGGDKQSIPFSAITAAKSLRRNFKLEYMDDHNDRKDLEIKLTKQQLAACLYRSITERHAFYVCDKVRGVVTNQFTRDLKGTIASMFNEDTELGKRYVFDIQHTCREVQDQARRILHVRGGGGGDLLANQIDLSDGGCAGGAAIGDANELSIENGASSMAGMIDLALREKEEREAAIERCVETRISEAMQCKICMDRDIDTVFNPCSHATACAECAARCRNCPNCRVKITTVSKIYLPSELRTNQSGNGSDNNSTTNPTTNNKSNTTNTNSTRSPNSIILNGPMSDDHIELQEISASNSSTDTAIVAVDGAPISGQAKDTADA